MNPSQCFNALALPWIVSIATLGASGCASPLPDDIPGAFQGVTGTVTMDGMPLAHVLVTFVPMNEGAVVCTGETDRNGRYRMSYLNTIGCVAGEYRVVLSLQTSPEGEAITSEMKSSLLVPLEASRAIERLAARYTMDTSTLTATVSEGGGVIDFALEGPLTPIDEPITK